MKNHKSHKLSDLNINGAISEVYLMDLICFIHNKRLSLLYGKNR